MKITYTATEEIICSIYRPCVSPDYPLGMMEEHVGEHQNFMGCLGDKEPTQSSRDLPFAYRFEDAMHRLADWAEIRARRIALREAA